ncbi:MAG TPA: hypothetical protein VG935_04080, partial [Patescibacteria group bacterium]|nr:hypothetical protein [Patescibacteria group bacterium]
IAGIGGFLLMLFKRARLLFCVYGIVAVFLIINRYYHGERSEGYLLYLTPFILLVTSLGIYGIGIGLSQIKQKIIKPATVQMIVVLVVVSILVAGSSTRIFSPIKKDLSLTQLNQVVTELMRAKPGKKFALYGDSFQLYSQTTALSYFLENRKVASPTGVPIVIICIETKKSKKFTRIITMPNTCQIKDITTLSKSIRDKTGWVIIDQKNLYADLIGRWETHPLTSTFSLTKYLEDKIRH